MYGQSVCVTNINLVLWIKPQSYKMHAFEFQKWEINIMSALLIKNTIYINFHWIRQLRLFSKANRLCTRVSCQPISDSQSLALFVSLIVHAKDWWLYIYLPPILTNSHWLSVVRRSQNTHATKRKAKYTQNDDEGAVHEDETSRGGSVNRVTFYFMKFLIGFHFGLLIFFVHLLVCSLF